MSQHGRDPGPRGTFYGSDSYDDEYEYEYEYDDEGYGEDRYGDDADEGLDSPAADHPGHSLQTVGRAMSPSGSIEVRTTMQGLPTAIRIERSEMDRQASTLAKTILLLCKQAGVRSGAAYRSKLLAEGQPLEAVSYLNLPAESEAAAFDTVVDEHFENAEPDTWMRRI